MNHRHGRHARRSDPKPRILAAAIIVLAAGVGALVLAPDSPVGLTSDDGQGSASARTGPNQQRNDRASTTSGPGTSTTARPSTSTAPPDRTDGVEVEGAQVDRGPSDLVLQVVPAVRDLQVEIGGERYASDTDGRIEATVTGSSVDVTVIGYEVTPAVQDVAFSQWGDGSTEARRTIQIDSDKTTLDLGVDIGYRIIVDAGGEDPADVELRDTDGPTVVDIAGAEPTAVPAIVAEPGEGGALRARVVTYDVSVDGRATSASPYSPTPEGLLDAS